MSGMWIFLALVFFAVFMLMTGLTIPVFSENRKARKRLLARLAAVGTERDAQIEMLLRKKYAQELTPLEQSLEALPGMDTVRRLLEQSGRSTPAYGMVLRSILWGFVAALGGWLLFHLWYWAAMLFLVASALPWLNLLRVRNARTAKFEEQLPEALDVIKRALQAGHPFTQCLKLVALDMDEPISREFDYVFSEVNYGGELRHALLSFLERTPSVSAMAFVTAVLVQKETGGNLAEILTRITTVIRGRFKLYRRIRTLSAEGRLSAWILMLMPLVLFAIISLTTPTYLPVLIHDPRGPKLIAAAVVLAILAMLWIRRIIRIRV